MSNIWHCIISKSNNQHNMNKTVSLISLYEFTFAENDSQLEHSTLSKLCLVWIIFSTAVLPVKARRLQSEPAPASPPSTHPSVFFTRETCWLLKWPWSCYNVAVMVSSAKSVCFCTGFVVAVVLFSEAYIVCICLKHIQYPSQKFPLNQLNIHFKWYNWQRVWLAMLF